MKWKAYALAAVVTSMALACKNSSDKESTTLVDTVVKAPDTTGLTTTDTTTTIPDATAPVTAKVPAKTKESFEKKYPQATNVKWEKHQPDKEEIDWELNGWPEMDEGDDKVWFHWQGSDHQGRYDKRGNFVGSTNEISDPSKLPAAVTNAIKSQYAGYTVKSVTKEDDDKRIAYEVKLEKGNEKVKTLIAENGTVIKTKKTSK